MYNISNFFLDKNSNNNNNYKFKGETQSFNKDSYDHKIEKKYGDHIFQIIKDKKLAEAKKFIQK